ncbi:MAG: adenylate/guanylate cyclase domain-containing protein [Microvirga sp.]
MADEKPPDEARERAARERLRQLRETAVRFDSHPGVVSAIERLRRRIPGDERFGDRLSTAAKKPVDLLARGVSALEPPRPSALHEATLGALQVWQRVGEAAGRGKGEQDVTILFTDLVGFSAWALDAGDEAAVELLRTVGEVVEQAVFENGGRIVKRLGDGVMAAFSDPDAAVEAALTAQEALDEVEVAGHRPRMRAGVHHGRPRSLGGDYLGVDVNVAARVAEGAKAGELLVSEPTCEQLDQERFQAAKPKRLKAEGAPRELRTRAITRAG